MNLQIIEIISLIIKFAAIIAVYKLLEKMVDRIRELEEEVEELKIMTPDRSNYQELHETRRRSLINRELIKQLVKQLDKKIEYNRVDETIWFDGTGWRTETTSQEPKIVDLTDSEKTAKKLREQADELEEEL